MEVAIKERAIQLWYWQQVYDRAVTNFDRLGLSTREQLEAIRPVLDVHREVVRGDRFGWQGVSK
jgi:hypothetical protein